jgi:hypothetical protein
VFVLRDRRNDWPFLLAGACLVLNEGVRGVLAKNDLPAPLTAFVGALDQSLTFTGSLAVVLALLLAIGPSRPRPGRA